MRNTAVRPGLRIRIHFIGTDPDPAFYAEYLSGSRGFDDQKWKKKYSGKKFLTNFDQIYLSLGLHKDIQVTKEAFSSQR